LSFKCKKVKVKSFQKNKTQVQIIKKVYLSTVSTQVNVLLSTSELTGFSVVTFYKVKDDILKNNINFNQLVLSEIGLYLHINIKCISRTQFQ